MVSKSFFFERKEGGTNERKKEAVNKANESVQFLREDFATAGSNKRKHWNELDQDELNETFL